MTNIEQEWENYKKSVLADVPEHDLLLMESTFFAGAYAVTRNAEETIRANRPHDFFLLIKAVEAKAIAFASLKP